MRHVFISYQRDDSAFVADLIRQIEDAGFRVWSDHERLREEEAGWREAIDQALRDAFALLLVITPAARTSEQMSYEWTFALGVGVPVIPVIRETAPLPPRLADLQRLDFTDANALPWGKLLRAIRDAQDTPRRGLLARSADRFGDHSGDRDRHERFGDHASADDRPRERPSLRERIEQDRESFGRDPRRTEPRSTSLDAMFRASDKTLDQEQLDKLYKALDDTNERDYRIRAAHRLGSTGDRAAIPHLIKALREEDWRLREAVAMALAKLHAGAAVPALLETLRRTRPGPFGGGSSNQVIMRAIRDIGASGLAVLIDALSDEEPRMRLMVVILLGEIGDPSAVPALTGALRDPEPRVRWKAAEALGGIGDVTAVPVLVKMLTDDNKEACIAATWALGQIGHQSAVEGLLKLMHNREWRTRWAAVQALWEIGADAVPALITKLADADEYVRRAASSALAEIGAPAIEALITTLDAEDWDTRWGAATALQEIGDKAVEALVEALDAGNWQTTWAAEETLKRIGTPDAIKAVERWQQARDSALEGEVDENTDDDLALVEIVDDGESDPRED